MNTYTLTSVHAVTPSGIIRDTALWVQDGLIRWVGPQEALPPAAAQLPRTDGHGAWAIPAFVDLHIHGFGGFGPETGRAEDLLAMSAKLSEHGVAAFCPTLYSAPPAHMEKLLRALAPAFGQETGAQLLGFHLEGPFISPYKLGVMKPQDIAAPDVRVLERFWGAAQGHIAALTLAPELDGTAPVLDFCRRHGILVQAGHTNATYTQMEQAARAGVTHITHLFNAMPPFHHREAGAAGYALMHQAISCEVIADGFHVQPEIISFLRTVKPVSRIVAVTDALKPTGQPRGPYLANGEEVTLQDGVWKRVKDGVIAGSALSMARALRNLLRWGYTLPQAVLCTSSNAARLLGQNHLGRVEAGAAANLVLLNADFEVQACLHP